MPKQSECTLHIVRHLKLLYVLDYHVYPIEMARENHICQAKVFPERACDLAIKTAILHHIRHRVFTAYLKNIYNQEKFMMSTLKDDQGTPKGFN